MCADAAHADRMRGSGNAHFKDGTSYATWFADMRPLILERDQHRCVTCGAPETATPITWRGQQVMRTTMTIHHISEDVTDNTPENLVTLCKTCHAVHHKSKATPWPWFAAYALAASLSMTSKWTAATTSLRMVYSPTTAS